MHNFTIEFIRSPWWLLLLIPAFALTFFLYFRLPKRYRRTRNRIISMVLHLIVSVLCVFVLAGFNIKYQVDNLENEIILLIDVSETEQRTAESRDRFVQTVLEESAYDSFKVGIVTFGFDQKYVAPLTYDVGGLYDRYKEAELPDTSATDIRAALEFTRTLFEHPDSAKILLISDGKQTDEDASTVIGSIATQGIRVDTVNFSSEYEDDNLRVVGVELPDFHVVKNQQVTIGVTLQSRKGAEDVKVEFFDNGEEIENGMQQVDLAAGLHTLSFVTTFKEDGLHELRVSVTEDRSMIQENNEYRSYLYLDIFKDVLIIEHRAGDSDALKTLLEEDDYKPSVLNLQEDEEIPSDVLELRKYDQIILNNIANSDFPDGFVEMLYEYVHEYGGGLFTVGGDDDDGNAHAYNRQDMIRTLYQDMLPVQAINYTPPVGVIVIIDISGSMGSGENSKLEWAKRGAIACLDALTERDYIGVMTLDSNYGTILPLTPRTQEAKIRKAINDIGAGGGTIFSDAIERAGQSLRYLESVDRRHIILVTDGMPSESDAVNYLPITKEFYETSGITLSVVGIDVTETSAAGVAMQELVETGHGRLHTVQDMNFLLEEMRSDLNAAEIKEVNQEPFYPVVTDPLSPVFENVEYGAESANRRQFDVQLGGFYGVKVRSPEYLLLKGDYDVPIYAQWKFGKGVVGSFMCDLGGKWSAEFMNDPNGKQFLLNVVSNQMPLEDIAPKNLTATLSEDNYRNTLRVYTDLQNGETISARVISADGRAVSLNEASEEDSEDFCFVVFPLGEDNECLFILKESGTYRIIVEKKDGEGNVVEGYALETYKAFSYSKEWDFDLPSEGGTDVHAELLALLARRSGGREIANDDPWSVFSDFVTDLDREIDPTLAFMIAALVLFLLDIAVRKFKFKWIHEIVRERRERNGGESVRKEEVRK